MDSENVDYKIKVELGNLIQSKHLLERYFFSEGEDSRGTWYALNRLSYSISRLNELINTKLKREQEKENLENSKKQINHIMWLLEKANQLYLHKVNPRRHYYSILVEDGRPVTISEAVIRILRGVDSLVFKLSEYYPIPGLPSLILFMSNFEDIGFDENWVVAAVYLTAMEIVVNKKRKELRKRGIKLDDFKIITTEIGEQIKVPKTFGERFNELLQILQDTDLEIKGILKVLPEAFWKARNDVVHGGHSPDNEELKLIVEWVQKIINALYPEV